MYNFEEDLARAVEYHGHLCAGQILGVRIAHLGLELLELDIKKNFKNLIVYVEADRCIADAVGVVTNCKLGKRSLKWMDYGKTAATFVDLKTGKAVRIASNGKHFAKNEEDVVGFFNKLSDQDLFKTEWVSIEIKKEDLPGKPISVRYCEVCGEAVMDKREVVRDNKVLCRSCAGNSYYNIIGESV